MPQNTLYQPFFCDKKNKSLILLEKFRNFNILRTDNDERVNIFKQNFKNDYVSYFDLGCNTGYLCDYASELGFINVNGIDICSTLIDICIKKSQYILQNQTTYYCDDLYNFFKNNKQNYDVISAYSVIQWIMIQKGDEYGIELINILADITNKVLIIEIGDYTELHYDKLKEKISTKWLIELIKNKFKNYNVYDKNTYKLKRDIIYFYK
jgi:SAM-dependent methyltransferase